MRIRGIARIGQRFPHVLGRDDIRVAEAQIDHILSFFLHLRQDEVHRGAQVGVEIIQSIGEFHFSFPLSGLLIVVDVADAAKKVTGVLADIFHPVGFHARHENGRPRPAKVLLDHFIGLGIKSPALEFPVQDVHGLMVEVVVNRNLPARLNREEPEAVLGVSMAVVPVLGEPSYARSDHIQHVPFVGELVDLLVFALFPIENFHILLLRNSRNTHDFVQGHLNVRGHRGTKRNLILILNGFDH